MPTVILANVRADYPETVREVSGLLEGTGTNTDTCARFLWHAREGDVVVIPRGMDPDYPEYVFAHLGMRGDSVTVIQVDGLMSDSSLQGPDLFGQLDEIVRDNPVDWSLFPFVVTPATVALSERLGVRTMPGTAFARERGTDLLNMKSTFRRLAAGVGVPIPAGCIARSEEELAHGLRTRLECAQRVVVKQDRGGGGHGNVGVTKDAGSRMPGTRETLPVAERTPEELAHALWAELSDPLSPTVVLEDYLTGNTRFFLEYLVEDNAVELVNSGLICYEAHADLDPKWTGLEVPLRPTVEQLPEISRHAEKMMACIQGIGYRGYINIDGLITQDGAIIFHETNARWGGGLVYHEVASRLLGSTYKETHLARSVLDLPAAPLSGLQGVLDKHDLAFDEKTQEGVVVLATNSDLGGGAELLQFARTRDRLEEIESRLRQVHPVSGDSPDAE